MKKAALLFFGSWAVLFLASFLTDETGLDLPARIACTGVLAFAPPLLYFVNRKYGNKDQDDGKEE